MADDSCAITLVFGQLMAIKSDANCQVSCDGGVCGDDWYPGTDDTCNAECGLVFEPFCATADPSRPLRVICVLLIPPGRGCLPTPAQGMRAAICCKA